MKGLEVKLLEDFLDLFLKHFEIDISSIAGHFPGIRNPLALAVDRRVLRNRIAFELGILFLPQEFKLGKD